MLNLPFKAGKWHLLSKKCSVLAVHVDGLFTFNGMRKVMDFGIHVMRVSNVLTSKVLFQEKKGGAG